MAQDYIQSPTQFQTLKPNIQKTLLKNLFSVASAVLVIIIILLIMQFTVGLDVYLGIFETFNINIEPLMVLLYFLLGTIAVSAFLLLGNYLVMGNVRYEFYQDKLISYNNALLLLINSKQVPYTNIVRLSYNNDSLFNTLFNSGTIVLELTGMKDDKIELEFIDNTEQIAQYIQNIMRKAKLTQQAQFTEEYKSDKILDKPY